MKFLCLAILAFILNCPEIFSEAQWASKVIGVSSENTKKKYSAKQALGKPSVMPGGGNTPCAWSPWNKINPNGEWIHLGYDKPIHVKQIAIAENYNPGVVTEIFLYDSAGKPHIVYKHEAESTPQMGRMLNIIIPKTDYRVFSVKLHLKTNAIPDWNQIDAVAISDEESPVKHEIDLAVVGEDLMKPENLGRNINSEFTDTGPVISPDGRTIYFTRQYHPANVGFKGREDVWYSVMDSNAIFSKAKNIGPPINNKWTNFAISVTQDGNGLLVGNVYVPNSTPKKGVSISYKRGNSWSMPQKIVVKGLVNKSKWVAYFLASNGKVLLCSIDNKESYGNLDLFVSFLQDDGSWSKPKNLGATINTAENELTPFLAHDMKTLYFTTNGYCGFGGPDIFISRRLDDSWENWSEPKNLGPVVNGPKFDAFFTIPASGNYAYFVSAENTYGLEDIFRIKLSEEMKPKKVVLVKGRVLNQKTNQPVDAKIIYEILPEGREAGIAVSNPETGEYQIVLPAGKQYGFLAQAEGFLSVSENLDLSEADAYSEKNWDLFIVPMEKGQKIALNNIFFEFGKYELLEGSYAELNRAAKVMNDYPDMKVEIAGHTDDVGPAAKNLELSEKRARAVADYLISKGVDKSRFTVKGYGEKSPVAPNNTEENQKKNRRVEFIVM